MKSAPFNLGLAGLLCWATTAVAEPRLVNGFAAIVNDKIITYVDVDVEVIDLVRAQYGVLPQNLAQEIDRLKSDALDHLVERELILHEFETAGYKMLDNIIEEHVRNRIRERFGDRVGMIRTLQAEGTTVADYRRKIRDDFIVMAMTSKYVSPGTLISPYKIEKYYDANKQDFGLEDRVKLWMISLANKPERGPEATRKLADEIHAKLEAGAKFQEMATIYSEDSHRKEGGDWGWVYRKPSARNDFEATTLRENLSTVAFSLKPGERSGVIEQPDGCYLMLVEEFQAAHIRPLAELRGDIEKTLRQKETARLLGEWMKRLRAKSFIQLFPLK